MAAQRRKKILIVQQYFYPDISAVAQLLYQLLAKTVDLAPVDITVLCGSNVRSFETVSPGWTVLNGKRGRITVRRVPTTLPRGKVFIHRLTEYLLFSWGVFVTILFHKNEYDITVSLTTPPLIGFLTRFLLGRRRKFIYYIEDLYPELLFDMGYIKRYWLVRKLRFFNMFILHRSDKIITISRHMTRKLMRNYNIDRKRITEIENWANGVTYTPPRKRRPFVLLYSGNIGLAHDFSLLPALLRRIEARRLPVVFAFYGAGRQEAAVRSIFHHTSVPYTFNGYTDKQEHNAVLASAHMFIISQKNETVGDVLPSKFYSYIAAGRPMLFLGTERSDIGEFIIKHKAGHVLEVETDACDTVDYLERMIQQRDRYRRDCRRIADLYRRKLGVDRSARRFVNVLREVGS